MARKYKIPPKRKGVNQAPFNHKIDPDLQEALRIFADRESKREGLKISQMTVLTNAALHEHPELRAIYKQLKKERNDAIRKEKRAL